MLGQVEAAAPLPVLLGTIAAFTAGLLLLRGLQAYTNENTGFGRISLRLYLCMQISFKTLTTSYPNLDDQALLKEREKSHMATNSNFSSSEAIWRTLTELLQNSAGFLIYLILFLSLDPVLILIVLATAALSYLASTRAAKWSFNRREEEASFPSTWIMSIPKPAATRCSRISASSAWGAGCATFTPPRCACSGTFVPPAARLLSERPRGRRADLSAQRRFLRLPAVFDAAKTASPPLNFCCTSRRSAASSTWISGILSGFAELHRFSLKSTASAPIWRRRSRSALRTASRSSPTPEKSRTRSSCKTSRSATPARKRTRCKNVSLKVTPGEKLAVVGLNGAGKTTLIKLICGFYDPTEGAVLLNGEDIRKYNRRDYYRHFSAVFQDFSIYETTLSDNVTQTPGSTDRAGMERALERAGLLERCRALPHGGETHIGRTLYGTASSFRAARCSA